MSDRLLIRNGLVIDPAQDLESVRDILLQDGRVAAIGPKLLTRYPGSRVIEARGCWVLPGLIDMHVHLREPGGEDSETIASGSRAAAAGGFTTVLAMPNTQPPIDSPAKLRAQTRHAAGITLLLAGCATAGQKGQRLSDLKKMRAAGMAAATNDGVPLADSGRLREALEITRRLRIPFISHCEDGALSRGAPVNEGRASRRLGLAGQPWTAEAAVVLRDIALAELTGAHLHIAHVSCRQSVAAIREAKRRGLRVTAEATPHHLALCEDDIPWRDPNFKMNPPLRSQADREVLQEALADGTLDAVATDHAPHCPAKKRRGIDRAPFGVIGLETAFAVILTFLVRPGRLTRRQFVMRLCTGPARILGLRRKGSLKPGMDADLAIVAPGEPWVVPPRFLSLSRNSPFIGKRLWGRVRATIAGGRIVHAL